MPVLVTIKNNLPEVTAYIHERIEVACAKIAFDIEAHAKQNAPVHTGFLRAAIQAEPAEAAGIGSDLQSSGASNAQITAATSGISSHHWVVVSYAEYSAYQELGTYKMAAQPYMIPAAESVGPSANQAFRQIAA